MFPTFAGRGDLVVAEALPGVVDRVAVGVWQRCACKGFNLVFDLHTRVCVGCVGCCVLQSRGSAVGSAAVVV